MILANGFTVRRTNPARAGGYSYPTNRAGGYSYPTLKGFSKPLLTVHEVLRNLCVGLEKPTARPNVREDTHIRPLRCEKGPEQRPILHRNCSVSDKNSFTFSLNYLYIKPFLILAQL